MARASAERVETDILESAQGQPPLKPSENQIWKRSRRGFPRRQFFGHAKDFDRDFAS